jgi:hypothetical protein
MANEKSQTLYEYNKITCPYCKTTVDWSKAYEGWGEITCNNCERKYQYLEIITRSYVCCESDVYIHHPENKVIKAPDSAIIDLKDVKLLEVVETIKKTQDKAVYEQQEHSKTKRELFFHLFHENIDWIDDSLLEKISFGTDLNGILTIYIGRTRFLPKDFFKEFIGKGIELK